MDQLQYKSHNCLVENYLGMSVKTNIQNDMKVLSLCWGKGGLKLTNFDALC